MFGPALRRHLVAVRALIVMTVVLGIVFPLAITAIAQIPGLKGRANGSLITGADGKVVGSRLLGQSFNYPADGAGHKAGDPIPTYFQSRPSAGTANLDTGYDPTATAASNLGPENIVDQLDNPATKGDDADESKQSLLTQVCSRSLAIGELEKVDGSRPFCTTDGVGAVLGVAHTQGRIGAVTGVVSLNQACPAKPFIASYDGKAVTCATGGTDYTSDEIVPIKGNAPTDPAVPADAVTASGSSLDPDISTAYAAIQVARIARERNTSVANVAAVVSDNTHKRTLGFLGEPRVNVLQLNIELDRRYPAR